jgi:lambda family phage portal protein
MFTQQPSEYTTSPNARIRVPADQVIHAYRPDSAMQTRGIPWATPAMYLMNMHRGYLEAEVTAARVGACQMGIVTNSAGDEFEGEGRNEDETVKLDAQPGGFLQLSQGQDFKSFAPQHPATAFPAFVKEVVRRIAAALGVSYNSLAEDLEGVNFSSIRAGLQNERDMWRVHQKWMIESFHKRVFRQWLSAAVMAGRIDISVRDEDDVAEQMVWHPRGWPWVDPLKDTQSNLEDVQNGFTSRSRVLAERGMDLEDVLNELKYEEELIRSLGLKLGTDYKGDALAPEDTAEGTDAEAQAPEEDGKTPAAPSPEPSPPKPKPKPKAK